MNIQTKLTLGDLYERDFHAWLKNQTEALQTGNANALDWPNLAEEIESMGKSQKREVLNRLTRIIEHLLKLEYGLQRDPEADWRTTVRTQRHNLEQVLAENPSLRNVMVKEVDRAYISARRAAIAGFQEHEPSNMPWYQRALPVDLPYTIDDLTRDEFFPTRRHP